MELVLGVLTGETLTEGQLLLNFAVYEGFWVHILSKTLQNLISICLYLRLCIVCHRDFKEVGRAIIIHKMSQLELPRSPQFQNLSTLDDGDSIAVLLGLLNPLCNY
jgi:hypothetical protein